MLNQFLKYVLIGRNSIWKKSRGRVVRDAPLWCIRSQAQFGILPISNWKTLSADLAVNGYGRITLKCLSSGTTKNINFPFVSNRKLMVFRCPNIQAHYNEAVLCLNFGTSENNEFSIWDKWKIYYF